MPLHRGRSIPFYGPVNFKYIAVTNRVVIEQVDGEGGKGKGEDKKERVPSQISWHISLDI